MTKQQNYPQKGATGAFNAKPSIEARRAQLKYKVSTTSTTAKGVVPIRGATKYPAQPEIYFTREAWVKQCHLVKMCSKEVGWFGLVDYDEQENVFTITELVIPCQEVTSAETNIGKEDLADAAMELIEQGKDTGKLYAWFHSHVNMGVSPSPQDEYQVEDYLEDLADQPEVPAFIRGIQNKAGDLKLDVYFIQHGVAYQNVDFYVVHDDDPQWLVDIESEIKLKVTERKYSYYNDYGYTSSGHGGGRQQTGKSQSASSGASGGSAANSGYTYGSGRQQSIPGWGYEDGFRSNAWRYDDSDPNSYYSQIWEDDYDDVEPVETSYPVVTQQDAPIAPKRTVFSNKELEEMEIIFMSPDYIEVMCDPKGQLWVCDERGDMYNYEAYTEVYGEIASEAYATATYIK